MSDEAAFSSTVGTLLRATPEIPPHEARQLLAHALGVDGITLLRDPMRQVDPTMYRALLLRRRQNQPLQYILGSAGFWDFDVAVSQDTLIPRADSETLVEAALAACPAAAARVLDLGTGTGCLLLALLRARPHWWGVGVDRAARAAALAAANAVRTAVAARACFLAGDWGGALASRFDLIVSNPPYVRRDEIATLAPEIRDWEPALALDGGADGLDAYRRILPQLTALLSPGGVAVLELGFGQRAAVTALAAAAGLAVVGVRADLGGVERALSLRAAA